MLHEPASEPLGKDYAIVYKTRLGVWMFVWYCVFYVGFVGINLYSPTLMEKIIFSGLNLATVYGFALIIVAVIMAIVYNELCTKQEKLLEAQANEEESK
jgi:uncharacterized membrane protein (DUF485 family)